VQGRGLHSPHVILALLLAFFIPGIHNLKFPVEFLLEPVINTGTVASLSTARCVDGSMLKESLQSLRCVSGLFGEKWPLFIVRRYASAVCCGHVSIHLSVHLSHAGVVRKWLNTGSPKQRHTIAQGI